MRENEFTRLYDEHAQAVYAFLRYRTGDPVLAEDLFADTFERVLQARSFDRRRGTERSWLYTIALNCVRDNARHVAAETRALARVGGSSDESAQLDGGYEGLELKEALNQALGTLRDEEREAVALRFGADLTLADIATVLNEPRSKIETRIYRGLKKLRDCLGSEF